MITRLFCSCCGGKNGASVALPNLARRPSPTPGSLNVPDFLIPPLGPFRALFAPEPSAAVLLPNFAAEKVDQDASGSLSSVPNLYARANVGEDAEYGGGRGLGGGEGGEGKEVRILAFLAGVDGPGMGEALLFVGQWEINACRGFATRLPACPCASDTRCVDSLSTCSSGTSSWIRVSAP